MLGAFFKGDLCFFYYKSKKMNVCLPAEYRCQPERIKEKLFERICDTIDDYISDNVEIKALEYDINKIKEKIKLFDRSFKLMMKCKQKRIIDDIMTII